MSSTDTWEKVKAQSEAALRPDIVEFIRACREEDHPGSQLISVLHKVQGAFGYLSRESMDAVAQLLGVPAAKVTGVATFYHFFRLTKPGKFRISVCLGTACYVRGADLVAEKFKEELGVDFAETSKDGVFTLEAARCLGTCGLAPVVMIGDDVYPQVTPDQVPALLDKYRAKGA